MQTVRIVLVAVLVVGAFMARGQASRPNGEPALREGTFTYGASVAAPDRQLIEAAIATADPGARALIERVDGAVTIEVGTPVGGAAGTTTGNRAGYDVVLDLGTVNNNLGVRGVNRLVLHELGHVVDHALVPKEMAATLDAAIPPCLDGAQPGCDQREERFAESFAKWAMNDIGAALYIGYAVPPPGNLQNWAAPLSTLLS